MAGGVGMARRLRGKQINKGKKGTIRWTAYVEVQRKRPLLMIKFMPYLSNKADLDVGQKLRQRKRKWRKEKEPERGHTQVTDRGRQWKSTTTNQLDCLITSCILHLSPILILPSLPRTPHPYHPPPGPSLLVHLHGNQTGCLIHELNIFPVAGWAGY